jgi:hypothetical protein
MTRWIALLLIPLLAGCVSGPSRGSDTGAKATTIDPATATPRHWMDKPATARISGTNYDRLWAACDAATRHYHFIPDVLNYRQGIMTSKPLVSKSAGEFWRNDVLDGDDLTKSTIATCRRTIRYDIEKTSDDRYEVGVKVLVERSSQFERRVTTGIQFRDAFGPYPPSAEFRSDDGAKQEAQYWYAVGRDETLEKALAQVIEEKLGKK